ncbi:MAG: FecR domain-containing protein [Pseudomonadota bacterium]
MTDGDPPKKDPHQSDDDLRRQAQDYVALEAVETLSKADKERILEWRSKSDRHERAYQQAVEAWQRVVAGTARLQAGSQPNPAQERNLASLTTRRGLIFGASGTIAGIAAFQGAVALGILPGLDALLADYATKVGEQSTVSLEPGIDVALDAGTILDRIGPQSVNLTAGAAVFTVGARPGVERFAVMAGPATITARKAVFEIHHANEAVDIACIEGEASIAAVETRTLAAGQKTRCWRDRVEDPVSVAPDRIALWRDGFLVVQDKTLSEVIADLNRHRRGRIILIDRSVANRRIGGTFNLRQPNALLPLLLSLISLPHRELPGGIVLVG